MLLIRPRCLVYMAIDGVAPRAKVNQQRSRRFKSAQEAQAQKSIKRDMIANLKSQGRTVDPSLEMEEAWDSNAITPGTAFMDNLATALRYWVVYKMNTDPVWSMNVILSDSGSPGEGEHKMMEYIRSQRASPAHNPNTRHVLYGLDADLIMLGLATHEPHCHILREDVMATQSVAKICTLCGQTGHEIQSCSGQIAPESKKPTKKTPYVFLSVAILREYLRAEMSVRNMPCRFDLERVIDEWVFLCFFVGNDFLPHQPSLQIREGAIDKLIKIWRDNIEELGGYITQDGYVNITRALIFMQHLADSEGGIFVSRRETELRRERNRQRRQNNNGPSDNRSNFTPQNRQVNFASDNKTLPPPAKLTRALQNKAMADLPGLIAVKPTANMGINKKNQNTDQISKANHAALAAKHVSTTATVKSANAANKSAASLFRAQLLQKKAAASDKNGAGEKSDVLEESAVRRLNGGASTSGNQSDEKSSNGSQSVESPPPTGDAPMPVDSPRGTKRKADEPIISTVAPEDNNNNEEDEEEEDPFKDKVR